jgi:DNA primase, catalytic core
MPLPQRFLDELIARTDLVALVGRYVPLKKKGGSYWGCCPFHHEKTPSFHVEQDKQFFKCFGCGEGGNAVHFMMKIENLPYIDAVHKLADMAGMEMPEDEGDEKNRVRRQRLLALNKDAARYFYETLSGPGGAEARAYLQKRGMTPQTVVRFGLGYADQSWDGLILAMRQKGYTDQELEAVRLAGRSKRGSLYCFFRDRIMFPIIDVRGDVVAFGGRILHGDGDGHKYINSPDNPVYSKSRNLYGLNLAKKSKEKKFNGE